MNATKIVKMIIIASINFTIFALAANWLDANIKITEMRVLFDKNISLYYIAMLVMLNIIIIFVYSYRLKVLIKVRGGVALGVSFIGAGLNNLLPMRFGEIAKLYYANRIYGVSVTSLIAASVIEKIFDLSALGLIMAMVMVFGNFRLIDFQTLYFLPLFIFLGLLARYLFLRYAQIIISRLRISEIISEWVISIQGHLKNWPDSVVIVSTGVLWLTNIASVYLGLNWLLPSTVDVELLDACAILLVIALALALPGAPAGLGVFEVGVVSYLTMILNVGKEEALIAALLMHFAISIPYIILSMLIIVFPSISARFAVKIWSNTHQDRGTK